MILRKIVILLCSVTGYFIETNGLYLNFAVPKNKALENIQNSPSPRNIDRLFRKGRHHHEKLVILDRKNKRVDDFVKKLLSAIEMNEGDKLLNEDDTLNKRKINCHMPFGSIYSAKAKRKRCKKKHSVYKRKQSWINFVIPVPVKNNIFSEYTRQGFSDDYLIDFNRRADIDFDYYNTAHRAQADSTFKHDGETSNFKSKKEVVAKEAQELDAAPKPLRRDHTRFKIVPSKNSYGNGNYVQNNPTDSDDSDSDGTDNTEDDDNKYKKNSYSDSDDNPRDSKWKRPMKKIKDEWNDIIKMPDTVPDSSEESLPKKHKRIKYSSETNSENEGSDSDASPKEDFGYEPHKNKGDNGKYMYMQGHRLYNTNLDEESRRMRIKEHFLPKRSYWNEDAINHLGAYWNSHEMTNADAS